jgi:hypothetical protein
VAIQQDDFLEPVVRERLRDVEHVVHEVLEVLVDGAGEVHDVSGVAVGHDRKHEQLIGDELAGPGGDADGADEVDVERQVVAVLLDGPTGDDANFAEVDGVVDLGPGEFFVAIFGGGAGHRISLGPKAQGRTALGFLQRAQVLRDRFG